MLVSSSRGHTLKCTPSPSLHFRPWLPPPALKARGRYLLSLAAHDPLAFSHPPPLLLQNRDFQKQAEELAARMHAAAASADRQLSAIQGNLTEQQVGGLGAGLGVCVGGQTGGLGAGLGAGGGDDRWSERTAS